MALVCAATSMISLGTLGSLKINHLDTESTSNIRVASRTGRSDRFLRIVVARLKHRKGAKKYVTS
jgi:hypothetical protein